MKNVFKEMAGFALAILLIIGAALLTPNLLLPCVVGIAALGLVDWVTEEEDLSEGAMTVRAQEMAPDDVGGLSWPLFAPRVDVDTTKINEINEIDDRPVADRREWDARGRLIPMKTPDKLNIEFIPIESRDALREKEINDVSLEVRGNQDLIREIIGVRIPRRVDRLAASNLRRIEADYISAWLNGYVTQVNPETGGTYQTSFQIDAGRIQTVATGWDDPSVNAYDEFLAWYLEGADEIGGSPEGVRLRRYWLNQILADAPDLSGGVKMTSTQLEQRISDDLKLPFRFIIDEESMDFFTDGGTARTRTKRWALNKLALVPPGFRVASTAFAPVVRAQNLVAQFPDEGIDVRGSTVFYDKDANGRGLIIECQLNAFPFPSEPKVWVIDPS